MTELVTILKARSGLATKTIGHGEDGGLTVTQSYSAGRMFSWREAPAKNIYDLAEVLRQCGSDELVIRGSIHDDKRRDEILPRRTENFGSRGKATEKRWVMLDLDKVEDHGFLTIQDDPEELIEWLISEYLPEPFHDVTCFFQFSSSAGIKPGVSAHLWFYLDRPVSGRDLTSYTAAHAPQVDAAPFGDVQAHYVAAPIFDNCSDPLPIRDGLLERERDCVTLPAIDRAELAEFAREHHGAPIAAQGFHGWLKLIGDGPGLAGFHEPIRNAIMAAVREQMTRGPVDDRQIKAQVREAITTAPKIKRGDDIRNYLSDEYLNSSINGAVMRRNANLIELKQQVETTPRISLAEGAETIRQSIRGFVNSIHHETERHAVFSEAGIGKSHITLEELAPLEKTQRIHYHIPAHRLGEEIAERFAKVSDETARIHRGRNREELTEDGQPMCFDDMKDKAAAFEEAGVGVYENLCKHCPHIGVCGWSRQKQDKRPGLIVMPVDYAFEESANRADIQVFDESFLRAADSVTKVNLNDLLSPLPSLPRRRGGSHNETWLDTALEDRDDLMTARSKFLAALDAADGKVPTFEQIREAGLTEEIARRAMGLEHQRADELHGMISHEHSVEQIRETITGFQHRGARQWAALWRSLAEQFPFERKRPYGWRRWEETKDGEILQRMLVRTTRDFRNKETPMLFLDATGDEQILRRFVPELTKVTRVAIELGDVTVTQVTDAAFAKTGFAPGDPEKTPPERLTRQNNNARAIGHFTELMANGRQAGLITYKATEEALAEAPRPNITMGHFNDTRGRNLWEDVDVLVMAGRPQPSENDVEFLTEAIFWREDVTINQGEYAETRSAYLCPDDVVPTTRVAHRDPLVEAVRYQICEGELIQNFARARPIRRGADNPVEIFILTNVPIPVPVNQLTTWSELKPKDKFSVAAARGVLLENAVDLATAYPDLFINSQAVRNAKRSVYFPYKELSIRGLHTPLSEARYQLGGAGQKLKSAYFNPEQILDIRDWLAGHLGELRVCEIPQEQSTVVARQAHNLKVTDENAVPASGGSDGTPTFERISNPLHYHSAIPLRASRLHPEGRDHAVIPHNRVLPAGVTELEPAASGVTGRRSNQLSYSYEENGGQGGIRTHSESVSPAEGAIFAEFKSDYESGGPGRNRTADRALDCGSRGRGRTAAEWDSWTSGLMPRNVAALLTETYRDCLMTQEQLAEKLGLSRPHLANAIQGRFGLTPEIVSAVKAFLHDPPIRQAALF